MTRLHRCPSRRPARAGAAAGHAMVETLLIVSFAAVTLAAIPAIADYGTKRMQTVAAAKLVAWQRTVWMPEEQGITAAEAKGASGAIKKTDAEVTRDLRRHIFLDRTAPGISIHAADIAEFEPMLPAIDPRTTAVTASSTAAPMPSLLNASDVVFDELTHARAEVRKYSAIPPSLRSRPGKKPFEQCMSCPARHARQRPQLGAGCRMTVSPTATFVTAEPISCTQPAFSWPSVYGSDWFIASAHCPRMMCRSVLQTPAPPIFTITSSGL